MSWAPKLESGKRAEDLALALFEGGGLKLLIRNNCCPSGELDLVLLDGIIQIVAEMPCG